MLPRQLIIASLALSLALTSVVRADGDRAKAEKYFRLGEKAYQAQNFAAAADDFEAAYAEFPIPEIAFSAAQAYRRRFRVDPKSEWVALAVKHYTEYLGKVKSGGRVADAIEGLAEMQQELKNIIDSGQKVSDELARDYTKILINPSLGKDTSRGDIMEVEDTAQKAIKISAKLDGEQVEPFAPLKVLPGKHRISVSAPGFYADEREPNVAQGETKIVDVELRPRPAKVTIDTEPGARILIDGRPESTQSFELQAGRHVLSVLHRGRKGVAREINVERGQQLTLEQPLEMTTRRHIVPWLLTLSGVAAVWTGVNVAFAVHEDHKARDILQLDIQTTGDQPQTTRERYENARTWRDRLTIASFTTGSACVLLAGIAGLLYYTDNPSPDGVRVEPITTPGGGGAAIAGRF